MRRSILAIAASIALTATGACSPAEVVVSAEIQQPGTAEEGAMQTMPLGEMEVALLPFDRDVVFDSLTEAAETPEPEIPADLLETQEQIRDAQTTWRSAEARWGELRDSLETLNEEMAQYSPAEGRYQVLYNEYAALEEEYNRMERQSQQAFERMDSLQKSVLQRSQQIRVEREDWADEAYVDVLDVFDARIEETGREIRYDTTSAQGVARFRVPEGEWWVHARYELPTFELYWNLPIQATGGETVEVSLTRENAEERPKL